MFIEQALAMVSESCEIKFKWTAGRISQAAFATAQSVPAGYGRLVDRTYTAQETLQSKTMPAELPSLINFIAPILQPILTFVLKRRSEPLIEKATKLVTLSKSLRDRNLAGRGANDPKVNVLDAQVNIEIKKCLEDVIEADDPRRNVGKLRRSLVLYGRPKPWYVPVRPALQQMLPRRFHAVRYGRMTWVPRAVFYFYALFGVSLFCAKVYYSSPPRDFIPLLNVLNAVFASRLLVEMFERPWPKSVRRSFLDVD